MRTCLALLFLIAWNGATAQPTLRELLIDWELWEVYSLEELGGFFDEGMGRDEAEERALALAGIARLGMLVPDFARRRFDLDRIRPHFDDGDSEVVRQAMTAYVRLASDDADAEDAIVRRARGGGGPLRDWEYIRYLRPNGITSRAAQQWLLELATGPISENKFSAAEALVIHMETPPPSLLPEVMALIRSREYFCNPNLTQFVPKFGSDAVPYRQELESLRDALSDRIGTAQGFRLAGSRTLGSFDLEMIEKAIAAIE